MSVGSVTARSHGKMPANISGRPSSGTFHSLDAARRSGGSYVPRKRAFARHTTKTFRSPGKLKSAVRTPRIARTRIPASVSARGIQTAGQRVALLKMAKLALRAISRSTPALLITSQAAGYLFNKVVEPDLFPGFENISPGWRWPTVSEAIGEYAPNFLDVGPWRDDPSPRSLLDTLDVGPPPFGLGIKYWGDFAADPYVSPQPGINWPTQPQWLPTPAQIPAVAPAPQTAPRPRFKAPYKPLRNLAPRVRHRPRARWRPNRNMEITINLRPSRRAGLRVFTARDVPRLKTNDTKAKPASQFVYNVLKSLANAMGETKEWIDILAEAAAYKRGSKKVPFSIRKGHETAAKAYWLFAAGGINQIDFASLAVLIVENEVEDRVFGFFGKLGASGSAALGLTVGVQTGPTI